MDVFLNTYLATALAISILNNSAESHSAALSTLFTTRLAPHREVLDPPTGLLKELEAM